MYIYCANILLIVECTLLPNNLIQLIQSSHRDGNTSFILIKKKQILNILFKLQIAHTTEILTA